MVKTPIEDTIRAFKDWRFWMWGLIPIVLLAGQAGSWLGTYRPAERIMNQEPGRLTIQPETGGWFTVALILNKDREDATPTYRFIFYDEPYTLTPEQQSILHTKDKTRMARNYISLNDAPVPAPVGVSLSVLHLFVPKGAPERQYSYLVVKPTKCRVLWEFDCRPVDTHPVPIPMGTAPASIQVQ